LSSCIEPPDQWQSDAPPPAVNVAGSSEPSARSYVPDALFADACSGAADVVEELYVDDAYPDADAAIAAMAGTWALCVDRPVSSNAGVQLLADGSWRDFSVAAGELVAGSGFHHEGNMQLIDTSVLNNQPGQFQVDFLPYGLDYGDQSALRVSKFYVWASNRALVFGTGNPRNRAVYLPVDLPVRVPPPEYADGARAGAAGCAGGERGIVATRSEALSLLSGDFVVCSGGLREGETGLRFEGTTLSVLDAAGEAVSSAAYEVLKDDGTGRLQLRVVPQSVQHDWNVVISLQPLKVWILEEDLTSVFSAMP
jgi:hypothetical protein